MNAQVRSVLVLEVLAQDVAEVVVIHHGVGDDVLRAISGATTELGLGGAFRSEAEEQSARMTRA